MKIVKLLSPGMIASLAVILVLAGCGDSAEVSLSKARTRLASNDRAGAIIELKNSLQKNPSLAEARFLLGKSYGEIGDAKSAEIELRKALALKYDPDKVIPELAGALLGKREPEKVLTEFGQTKLNSSDAQADLISNVGMAYLMTGKMDQALASFEEALKAKPDFAPAVLGESRALFYKGDAHGAAAKIETVLAKNPKNITALIFKADLARAENDSKGATLAYEQAVKEDPKNFYAHYSLANLYFADGKFDAATGQVQVMKKLAPKHASVSYFEALLAFNRKDYPAAAELIQQSLAVNPDNPQALVLAGTVELLVKQPAISEQHLRKAINLLPGNIFAHKQLAQLYLQQKQPLKAEEVLKPLMEKGLNDASLFMLAGDVAVAKGEFSVANKYYEQASKMNPGDANAMTKGALVQFAQGQNEHAFAQLESASKADPSNARADMMLVLARLKTKDYDRALTAWESLQKRQPNNPMTYNVEAAIRMGKGDAEGARKALEHAIAIQPTYFPAVSNLSNLDLVEKKLDSAKQRYRTLLEKDKNNLPALLALSTLELSGNPASQDALKLLNQARQGNPGSPQPVVALINYYMGIGDNQRALAVVRDGLGAMPRNPQMLDAAGLVAMRTGDASRAADLYGQLAAEATQQPGPLLHLAEAQLSTGNVTAATQTLNNALQLQPDSFEVQSTAVGILLRANKPDDALRIIERIQKLSPTSQILPQLEGDAKVVKGDYGSAATAYKKAMASRPNSILAVKVYQALTTSGNKAEADSFLATWLKTHPQDTPVQLYLADSALNARDYEKAASLYKAIIDREPGNVFALNNMAWVGLETKDPKAIDYAQKAYALEATSPAVGDTLGWILVEKGEVKRGIELLERASNQVPQRIDIRLHLAKALIKDGRKDVARQQLQTIVKSQANSDIGRESAKLLASL